jgi:hypothetical protein
MSDITTTSVYLTDEELALLDGKCQAKVQKEVDKAKERLSLGQNLGLIPLTHRDFVTRIIQEAQANGELSFTRKSLSSCKVCGKSAGYAKYTRNSKYHDKGDPNYKRPLTFPGVDLASRFVTIRGRATMGCCWTCWKTVKEYLPEALKDVKAQIPESITGYAPKFKKHDNRKCKKCGWKGHKGEMGRLPCAMSRGTYAGKCPQCDAKNLAFGPTVIKTATGFVVVEKEQ